MSSTIPAQSSAMPSKAFSPFGRKVLARVCASERDTRKHNNPLTVYIQVPRRVLHHVHIKAAQCRMIGWHYISQHQNQLHDFDMPGNSTTRRDAYITSRPKLQAEMPAHDHAGSAAVRPSVSRSGLVCTFSREDTVCPPPEQALKIRSLMAITVIIGPMMMDWHLHTHYASSLRERLLSLWSN